MKLEKRKPTTKGEQRSADYDEIMAIRSQVLREAANEVRSHWNDKSTMVNQLEQAERSANVLDQMANGLKRSVEDV